MTSSYRYRASTPDGQVVEGFVQAASPLTALEELRRQRLYPVDLAPVAGASEAPRKSAMGRGPALSLFTRTVATMLGAGVALDRAVAFAASQARHPAVAEAAQQVHQAVREGASLADSMARHPAIFSPLTVAMVAAGEESGALDESMVRLADHLDQMDDLRGEVRAALLYPALMAVVSGTGITVLVLFGVPRFAAMIADEGGALPLSTRLLVGAGGLMAGGWWALLLGAALVTAAGRSWLADSGNRRRWHAWRLGLPWVGDLELKHQTAAFARALGMLLGNGRPLLPALRAARATVSNAELGARLDRAAEAVSHGKAIHVALSGTLPPLATELIAVGEESGRLDDLCSRVADVYDGEVRRTLRTLVGVIEPAMILLFALVVGFVALAMLQAIYGINSSLL